jgi:hypothetical protein
MKSTISAWLGLTGNAAEQGIVIYRGDAVVGKKSDITVCPWWFL